MSFQLFDRLAAFFRQANLYRKDSLFSDQTALDRLTAGGELLNFGQQNALLEQTNLQINRLERYKDFDQMDEVGVVSQALDLYGDEASLQDPETQHALMIKAKSKRVKEELEDFFFNVIMIDHNLRSMVRYLCKYGDFAAELVPTKNRDGVMNLRFMNVYNFTRVETRYGDLVGFFFQDQLVTEPLFLHPWQVMHLKLTSYENIYEPYGRCQKFGTRVLTPNGYKNIENFQPGDDVYAFHENRLVPTKVIAACHSGEKEIYQVRTKHFQNKCSGNHPVLIRQWQEKPFKYGSKWFAELIYKRADELTIGDELVIPRVPNNHNYQILGDIEGNVVKGDEQFARLFGFLVGDGWLGRYRVDGRFKNNGVEFALGEHKSRNQYYSELLNYYSPNKIDTYKKGKSKSSLIEDVVNTCSVDLSEFLEESCGFVQGSKNKRIPQWVYNSPRTVKIAFIEGLLDADRSSNVDEWDCERLQIELANYELARDIKMLLHDIGWKCGQILKRCRGSKLVNFHGKTYERAEAWYIYFYQSDLFTYPLKNWGYGPQSRKREYQKHREDVFFEKIISIEKVGIHPTADIQVEHYASNFVADGIVVHNSLLDPARKNFKQLRLMEDAALVYRISRASEKRVFTIPVGNIPTHEVPQYIELIAHQLKRKRFFDPSTGDVNQRWSPLIQEDDYYLPARCISKKATTYVIEMEDKMLSDGSIITLMNSKEKTLGELVQEYGHLNKEFWVYSYNPKTKQIIPAKAKACISPKDQQMVRVNLDNGESIECTPDHKFMARDGQWIEAQDLQSGQSLMPLYRRRKVYYGKSDYEQVRQPNGGWEWTHKMVLPDVPKDHVRHHIDFNRFNNSPDNLEVMHFVEHRKIHQKHARAVLSGMSEEDRRKGAEKGIIKWNNENPELRKQIAGRGARKAWKEGKYDHLTPDTYDSYVDLDDYKETLKELILETGSVKAAARAWNADPKLRKVWKANHDTLTRKIKKHWGYDSVDEFAGITVALSTSYKYLYKYGEKIRELVESHGPAEAAKKWNSDPDLFKVWKTNSRAISKVAKAFGYQGARPGKKLPLSDAQIIERLKSYETIAQFLRDLIRDGIKIHPDTITSVLKRNGYSSFKEFKNTNNHKVISVEWLEEKQDTYCLVVPETKCFFLTAGVLVHNSDGTGPTVTTLPGAENLDKIADIEYFKKNMVSALKIPFHRVGLGESTEGNDKSLAQTSPDFAHTIQHIQREVAIGLKKVAIVHLALKGFKEQDLRDFDIYMTASSAIDELYRIETWASRANVIAQLNETGIFPKTWLLKHFTPLTDDEIEEMEEEQEKARLKEMEQLGAMGPGMPMGGGLGGLPPPPPPGEPGELAPLEMGAAPMPGEVPPMPEGYDQDLESKLITEINQTNTNLDLDQIYQDDRSLFKTSQTINSGFENLINNCELDGLQGQNGEVLCESILDPTESKTARKEVETLLRHGAGSFEDNEELEEEINKQDLPH